LSSETKNVEEPKKEVEEEEETEEVKPKKKVVTKSLDKETVDAAA